MTNDVNRLLAVLPPTSRESLVAKLNRVPLNVQAVLMSTGQPISAVYFPLSGWVSTVIQLAGGRSAEVGLVGREGMIGLSTTNKASMTDQMVQGEGYALSMSKAAFEQERRVNDPLRHLLERYQGAIYAQTAVTVACNGWHELEQRLARWLLASLDRADSNDLTLTQDFLAMMLCVHRPRVTTIARSLQAAGIITYGRGHIVVLDREALEATACECYQTMRDQIEHVYH